MRNRHAVIGESYMKDNDKEYLKRTTERLRNLPSVKKDDRKAKQVRDALKRGGRTNERA